MVLSSSFQFLERTKRRLNWLAQIAILYSAVAAAASAPAQTILQNILVWPFSNLMAFKKQRLTFQPNFKYVGHVAKDHLDDSLKYEFHMKVLKCFYVKMKFSHLGQKPPTET